MCDDCILLESVSAKECLWELDTKFCLWILPWKYALGVRGKGVRGRGVRGREGRGPVEVPVSSEGIRFFRKKQPVLSTVSSTAQAKGLWPLTGLTQQTDIYW